MHPFLALFETRRVILDGSMGATLQGMGLPAGMKPMEWNVLNPDTVKAVHRGYLDAGADVVYANTFGFDPEELSNWEALLTAGVRIAKEAVKEAGHGYATLDLTSLGKLLKPFGEREFEDAVQWYHTLAAAGIAAGCDLIVLETMTCLKEIKAAVLGIRQAILEKGDEIPFVVSMSPDENGRLLTGSDIEGAAAMLTAMDDVDALGINCHTEPKLLMNNLKRLLACAGGKPVWFKPNGGIPELVGGCTVFKAEPEGFGSDMAEAVTLGAHAVGGCCGTTDKHIAALVKAVSGLPYTPPEKPQADGLAPCRVSGHSQTVTIGEKPVVIGERINPTGKPKLKQALRDNDMNYIKQEAVAQMDAGADVLDVNVGLPGIDEAKMLAAATEAVQAVTAAPLQLDSADPAALEAALRAYTGKPIINSVSGKQSVMDAVFPLARKYGAALVALCLNEDGIPETADGRLAIAKRILAEADRHGVPYSDLLFDGLTMAAAADSQAPGVTLETVRRLRDELHVKTVLGVSNVSFGLPNRSMITAAFVPMALYCGLSAAIINPLDSAVLSAFHAASAALGHDPGFADYIRSYADLTLNVTLSGRADAAANPVQPKETLEQLIIGGMEGGVVAAAKALMEAGEAPLTVIETHIIPALTEVGARYESGKIFLPQLMQSANAAKAAIAFVSERMPPREPQSGKTIVLATVEGDVHDIGKNIVSTMLQSYGFEVLDLGKNVPPQDVLAAVAKTGAKLLGLSALMTTTVPSMRETIALVRREHMAPVIVMVGGAVLTETLAKDIGADYYAPDAMASVRIAKDVLGASPL